MRGTQAPYRYAAAATALALVAVMFGRMLVDAASFPGVIAGAGVALAIQWGVFLGLGTVLLPERRILVFALGMGLRIFSILIVALVAPRLGLPLAPTLFTLAAVYVLTTLLEPLLLLSQPQRAS